MVGARRMVASSVEEAVVDGHENHGVNEYHSRIIAATGTAGVILVYIRL